MTHIRTYRANVRIGNWNEDLRLTEDAKKEYLEKKEKGELTIQKVDFLKQNLLRPVKLTVTSDGRLHFGDVVILVNMGGENRECSVVSINTDINSLTKTPSPGIQAPCGVSAGRVVQACTRTAFIITSVDGSPEGSMLHFEQSFALKTTSGFARGVFLEHSTTSPFSLLLSLSLAKQDHRMLNEPVTARAEAGSSLINGVGYSNYEYGGAHGILYLTSDLQSFQKCAEKSRLQEVNLDVDSCFLSWWKIVHFDPQERLEYEELPVPANVKVLIIHCKTNQALAALSDQVHWTTYGKEYEVTAHTFLDSHKAEQDNNHWILCTSDPAGNGLVLLNHPQSAANNKELTQATPVI